MSAMTTLCVPPSSFPHWSCYGLPAPCLLSYSLGIGGSCLYLLVLRSLGPEETHLDLHVIQRAEILSWTQYLDEICFKIISLLEETEEYLHCVPQENFIVIVRVLFMSLSVE